MFPMQYDKVRRGTHIDMGWGCMNQTPVRSLWASPVINYIAWSMTMYGGVTAKLQN